jgi:hypothetical protein
MNELYNKSIDSTSFAYRDLMSVDRWETFTPSFPVLTLVGAPSYVGRYRIVGRQLQFQVLFAAATSIASVAGTSYMSLPIGANGLSGIANMTNDTTKVAVGVCHIDVTNSRCYLPAQAASGNIFALCGSYEIGG